MKKTYISPTIDVFAVQTSALLNGSIITDDTSATISVDEIEDYGGTFNAPIDDFDFSDIGDDFKMD